MTATSSPDTAADPALSTVCVINKGTNTYVHGAFTIKPGQIADIPQEVFDVLKTCFEFGSQVILEAGGKAAAAAQAALIDVNAELTAAQAEIALLTAKLAAAEQATASAQQLLESATQPATAAVVVAAAPDGS
jgi:hypothetical protein